MSNMSSGHEGIKFENNFLKNALENSPIFKIK